MHHPPIPRAAPLPEPAALRARIASGLGAAAGRQSFRHRRRRFDIGFTERQRRRAARRFAAGSFALMVLLPALLGLFYFGWLAEDQFETEARFLLRANRAAAPDRVEALSGIPSVELRRDTQVIAAFLRSAALLDLLERTEGLRARYEGAQPVLSRPETWARGDWPARLAPDATAEDLLDFWQGKSAVDIELPAGILVFSLRAFRPADARALAARAVQGAEALVNDMNLRIWSDAVTRAEELFAEAADRLAAVQGRLAQARNRAGVVSVEAEAGSLAELTATARAELIRLEQERAARARHLAPDSAAMQALDRRIAAMRAQVEALARERVAGAGQGGSLADAMAAFSGIEAEQEVAERQFLAAARKLEQVRQASRAQMLYLDVFVAPRLPEEATHPDRALMSVAVLAGALALWGAVCGAAAVLRNHMA